MSKATNSFFIRDNPAKPMETPFRLSELTDNGSEIDRQQEYNKTAVQTIAKIFRKASQWGFARMNRSFVALIYANETA
jgi:hypothetical protein